MDPNQHPNYNPNNPNYNPNNPNQNPNNQFFDPSFFFPNPPFPFDTNVYRPRMPHPSSQQGFFSYADYGTSQHGFSSIAREVIPETQPEPEPEPEPTPEPRSNTKGKGKKRASEAEPQPPPMTGSVPWTPDEEYALAKAWVDTSECPIVGNNQKSADFWKKLRNEFFKTMARGAYRTNNAISSKWRDINHKVSKFNGIYSEKWQTRRSGVSDADIERQALDQFRADLHVSFTMIRCWELMRKCPKWRRLNAFEGSSSKRSKTSESESPASSDARIHFNLNDSDDEEEEEEEGDGEPVRPIGRDRAKAERARARRGSSSQTQPDYSQGIESLTQKIGEANMLKAARQRHLDLQFLMTPSDQYTGVDREIIEREKERIRKQFNSGM